MHKNEVYFSIIIIILAILFSLQSYYGERSILEFMEDALEVINGIIAIFAAIMAWMVAKNFGLKMNDGSSWRWLAISAVFFAAVEVLGFLQGVGIWEIEGLLDFVEFGFVVALARGFWEQRNIMTDILEMLARKARTMKEGYEA